MWDLLDQMGTYHLCQKAERNQNFVVGRSMVTSQVQVLAWRCLMQPGSQTRHAALVCKVFLIHLFPHVDRQWCHTCESSKEWACPSEVFHSSKLTWQWKITIFNGGYIFKWVFFHCHGSFPECTNRKQTFLGRLVLDPEIIFIVPRSWFTGGLW